MPGIVRAGLSELAYGRENSAFSVNKGDRMDYAFALQSDDELFKLARQARFSGVDAREVYYALSGCRATAAGPAGDTWREVLRSKPWKNAKRKAQENRVALLAEMRSMLHDITKKADPLNNWGNMPDDADPSDLVLDEDKMVEIVPQEKDAEKAETIAQLAGILAGGLDTDNPQQLIDEVMLLSSKLDIKAFSDMLGWLGRIVRGVSRRTQGGSDEMTGYGSTGWSDKVVAQDQLAVAKGDIQALARLAEGQLTTREYSSHRPMGKGPVIVLRDETSSMCHSSGKMDFTYKKHKTALAMEVALADAFFRDGRDLHTVAWGTTTLREHLWGTSEYTTLKEHLGSFLRAGDTRIKKALYRALDIAEEYVSGADILVLTDGGLSDSAIVAADERLNALIDEYRSYGGRIWVVVIGGAGASTWENALPFADAIVSVENLQAGNNSLRDIIAGMAERTPGKSQKRQVN